LDELVLCYRERSLAQRLAGNPESVHASELLAPAKLEILLENRRQLERVRAMTAHWP